MGNCPLVLIVVVVVVSIRSSDTENMNISGDNIFLQKFSDSAGNMHDQNDKID